MKAIVYTRYGPPEVLQLREVSRPMPADHQVLVRVHAASINALDYRRFASQSLTGRFMDSVLLKAINQIPGADIAGRVEATGKNVTQFKPGDAVFGVSAGSMGAFAEYTCTGEKNLVLKPVSVSFEAAAAVPVAALTALQGLHDNGQIQPRQTVLIHGASGGVGTFAVQIAKSFGAEVTAVCSTRNLDMVRSIGADHVMDYTKEDFTRSGQRYDLIIAVNGHHSIQAYRRALNPGGKYVAIGGSIAQVLQAMSLGPLLSRLGDQQMGFMGIAKINQKNLVVMKDLLEAGKVVPVIDRCYPLNETAEAVRYLVTKHAQGKVVLIVEQNQPS
jgi:NADPH:quinone reductase-like Zn-dependent oxidoreductase